MKRPNSGKLKVRGNKGKIFLPLKYDLHMCRWQGDGVHANPA
jgi:hypothetical protein